MYINTSEASAIIRKELKEKYGYNNRMVSVKSSLYAIKVRCKVDGLDKKGIYRIANKFRSVDYDEITGEILSGGNTYVFIEDTDGRGIPYSKLV